MTESDVMSLAELQAQFEDSKRALISNGDLRRFRETARDTSRRLGALEGWVGLYLAGKASVAELTAAHEASVAVTP